MKIDKIKAGKTYLTRKPRNSYEKNYRGTEAAEHYVSKIESDLVYYVWLENKNLVGHQWSCSLSEFAKNHVRQLTTQEEIVRFAVADYQRAINNQRAKAPSIVEYDGHVWKKDSNSFFYTDPPFKIIPDGISMARVGDNKFFYAEGETLETLEALYEEEMICRALAAFIEERKAVLI